MEDIMEEKYQILDVIGRGGTSTVYKVMDKHIQKEYAMKVVLKDKYSDNEVTIIKQLEHSCLPKLVDVFEWNDRTCIVMEYIKGCSLAKWRKGIGRVSKKELERWATQLAQALSYLHGQPRPIVYGDLKPENIIVTENQTLKFIDFGASILTFSGDTDKIWGTPGYAALEQTKGEIRTESDIYALGKVLQFLVTGRNPLLQEEIPQKEELRRYGVSDHMIQIIQKCCNPDWNKRFHGGYEVLTALSKRSVYDTIGRTFLYRFQSGLLYVATALLGFGTERFLWEGLEEGKYWITCGFIGLLLAFLLDSFIHHTIKKQIFQCEYSVYLSEWKQRERLEAENILLLFFLFVSLSFFGVTGEKGSDFMMTDAMNRSVLIRDCGKYEVAELLTFTFPQNEKRYFISWDNGRWFPIEESVITLSKEMFMNGQNVWVGIRECGESAPKICETRICLFST